VTNKDFATQKLRWNADYYKSLSDDDCIICLTEKQIYLVGQYLEAITWENTRWVGDKSGLDFVGIAGNLEEALAERMTCEKLTLLVQQIESINVQLSSIQTMIFEGDNTIEIDGIRQTSNRCMD